MPTISPALLFDGDAEDALAYYSSIFDTADVTDLSRYGADAPYPEGTLLAATLVLEGLSFTLINGPDVPFTDAVSFMVSVDGQEEVDRYWNALTADGEENWCGWLRDKWGLAWQIVPKEMGAMIGNLEPAKAQAAMKSMMTMKKIVLADMQKAIDEVDG
jgi:predicted 3-demethylubiquinone-9 3-methyltransferase (glyoxalase superfamily)